MKKNMRKSRKKTSNEKSYYKHFVIPCVILLGGYYFSAYNGFFYSDFSFLYVILPVVVIVVAGMKCLIKSKMKAFTIGWWAFCVSLASFFILNVIYTEKQETSYFMSQVEDVASQGYRSSASIFFQIDGQAIWLPVRNEIPIKEKLKKGTVCIWGSYKRGLSSSIMIIDYQTN